MGINKQNKETIFSALENIERYITKFKNEQSLPENDRENLFKNVIVFFNRAEYQLSANDIESKKLFYLLVAKYLRDFSKLVGTNMRVLLYLFEESKKHEILARKNSFMTKFHSVKCRLKK